MWNIAKSVIFSSFATLLAQGVRPFKILKASIFYFINVRVLLLITEVLWLLQGKSWGSSLLERASENCQIAIYSVFNSFACIFQGAIFVLQLNVWRSFARFWPVLHLKSDELIWQITPTLDFNCLINFWTLSHPVL